jgi:hypothetical protein
MASDTPLHVAAKRGDLEEAKRLVEEDLSLVDATGAGDWTALTYSGELCGSSLVC